MDKYYTPEISEFFVGFEYETSYLQDYDTWKKEILEEDDAGYFHSIYFGDAVPTEFRVKYLSKEDIESLGFKFKTDLYVKDDLTLQVHKDSITIKYYDNFNNDSRTLVEQINIKTKDEFITLLKQLRIG